MDSNPIPPMPEATTPPTLPQPLHLDVAILHKNLQIRKILICSPFNVNIGPADKKDGEGRPTLTFFNLFCSSGNWKVMKYSGSQNYFLLF